MLDDLLFQLVEAVYFPGLERKTASHAVLQLARMQAAAASVQLVGNVGQVNVGIIEPVHKGNAIKFVQYS